MSHKFSSKIFDFLLSKHPAGSEVPIHDLICKNPPRSILGSLLKARSDSAKQEDSEGNLPLHTAARHGTTSICSSVLELHPDGLLHKNKAGILPIGYADGNESLLLLIATRAPESLQIHDTLSRHPILQFLKKENRWSQKKKQEFVKKMLSVSCLEYQRLAKERDQLSNQLKQQAKDLDELEHSLTAKLKEQEQSAQKQRKDLEAQHSVKEEQLKASHRKEKDDLRKSFATKQDNLRKSFATKQELLVNARAKDKENFEKAQDKQVKQRRQLESVLTLYQAVAIDTREREKGYLDKLLSPEYSASIEELKSFASDLGQRVYQFKEEAAPFSEASLMQLVLPSLMSHPDPAKSSLIACIQSLDAELTSLEAKIEASNFRCSGPRWGRER